MAPLPRREGRGCRAFDYLLSHDPATIEEPYVLAQVVNALLAIRPGDHQARPYLERLEAMGRHSADGKLAWWDKGVDHRTTFYGAGVSGNIETTALATLAMIEGRADPATIRASLAWLVEQKDAHGTWHSTQATVLALKALLAGTDRPLGEARRAADRCCGRRKDGADARHPGRPRRGDAAGGPVRPSRPRQPPPRDHRPIGNRHRLPGHAGLPRARGRTFPATPSRFRSSSSMIRPRSWSTTG